MNSKELREKFLTFFKQKGHKVIPSSSLLPENDPTVLFTTAGMQPLVPNLLGERHPEGTRLTNLQKCIRTIDIGEVGDATHLTFFEMMGYWSLGDYWKKEALSFTFEFVTKELGIPLQNIAVSCFVGEEENGIPKDEEAAGVWRELGIAEERIAFLGREDNFWGPAGEIGPCGPDSEIFVWIGGGEAPLKFDSTDKGWMEIGNDVFMQYNKTKDGKYELLSQKNVDFGSGYERVAAYIEGRSNVYETELFEPILNTISEISGKNYSDNQTEFRIIADHLKAATFIINDGALPSNKGAGYIVRRLIRRAIVKAQQLGIDQEFAAKVSDKVFEIYSGVYDFDTNKVKAEIEKEETKFRRTLKEGLKLLGSQTEIDGKVLFDLYQSYGLPLEISIEEARNQGNKISNETIEQFNQLMQEHQELSRTASAGMFKGGLSEAGEITTKYHTATHLLLAALRQVLGDHVFQKGSNITAERMRFDFSHSDKLTPEQISEVEGIVNDKIKAGLPVIMEEMALEDARNCGAMGVFDSKYGDKVKVYSIGDFSKEMCGGPHVKNTGELGEFKILKEEASSAGVRRIKAVLN